MLKRTESHRFPKAALVYKAIGRRRIAYPERDGRSNSHMAMEQANSSIPYK